MCRGCMAHSSPPYNLKVDNIRIAFNFANVAFKLFKCHDCIPFRSDAFGRFLIDFQCFLRIS